MDEQRTTNREAAAAHADSLLRHFRFRSLDAFRAVYETHSVTRAAARLGLSQPAVSQLLGGLERAVGVALFTRGSGRRLAPTEAAHRLFGDVLRAIGAMEALEATAAALRRAGARLRVTAPPSLADGFVPEVIARLRRQAPGVEIELGADA
ncbi:MAG: LysR family transcriptional regulator, partial [Alphaproteobacteria bacterium]